MIACVFSKVPDRIRAYLSVLFAVLCVLLLLTGCGNAAQAEADSTVVPVFPPLRE